MGTSFRAKNPSQKIPTIAINSRIVTQPGIHYTCPAGKKAIFEGVVICTSLGASATAFLRDPTDTFNLAGWKTPTCNSTDDEWDGMCANIRCRIIMQLDAGDVIKTTQTTGTNAEFNVIGKIQETPA